MKTLHTIIFAGVLLVFLLLAGCTTNSPSVTIQTTAPTPAPVPATELMTPSPTPAALPYPNALPLMQYARFGKADMTGNATVLRYAVMGNYNWTSPTFSSPHDVAQSAGTNGVEHGYNTEKTKAGDTFLFIFVRVVNTGPKAVYSPSASQFVVSIDGKTYNYSPVESADVTIDKISGTQYDYQIGQGGAVGYVQPGESNAAEGYLIYEVPAAFAPERTYVVSNLDYEHQAVWKLV